MSPAERLAPPRGGTPPPDRLPLPGGETCFLSPLAADAAAQHWREFPDEADRYGPAGLEWCAHDLQWVLAWALLDAAGDRGLLRRQLEWLAGVLGARDYPTERLTRAVAICADVVEREVADSSVVVDRLRAAAAAL